MGILKYFPSDKQVKDFFVNLVTTKSNVYPDSVPEHIIDALGGLLPEYSFGSSTTRNHLLKGYGKNPHVYSVIDFISKKSTFLPYDNLPDYINIYDDLLTTFISLLATGNAFLKKGTAVGFEGTYSLELISTLEIEILHNDNLDVVGYKRTSANGTEYTYNIDEIIHIKLPNIVDRGAKALWGLSPLHSAVSTYESSNNIKEAEASIFKNFGATGMLTNDSDVPILESEREEKDSEFKLRSAGAGKFGKILMSNHKLRYLQLGMSPTALKMIDANIEKLRTICSIYGLNSVLFNDQVSSSYNNIETATINAYNDVILPLSKLVIGTLNDNLLLSISINENNINALKVKEDETANND